MASKAALSEAEYLRTSFPGVDQEYRNGELVERGVPDLFHSSIQKSLILWFGRFEHSHSLYAFPELRLRVRPGRVLIPDICVFWPMPPTEAVPEDRPLIVVEVLSPDDTLPAARAKLEEYAAWGVPHVWLIEPRRKWLYSYIDGLHEVREFPVPEAGLTITPAGIFGAA